MSAAELFHLGAVCNTLNGWLPSLYDHMTCNNGALQISAVSDLIVLVVNIVRILMAVAGAIGVVMLLVASIYYITSTGDPGRTKTAKDIIQYTVIGLIVILVGYGAMSFVAAAL